jgi:hypothetical protein
MAGTSMASEADSKQANQQDGNGQKASTAGGGSSSPLRLSGPALWTAILALVVWVGFSVVMLFFVSKSETEWTRVAWIFGSIQSVAFAAAGAIFGTAVQQQNVSSAQQDAANAKKDADTQRETAVKGRALAAALEADGATSAAGDTGGLEAMDSDGTGTTEAGDTVRRRHAQLAQALFGEMVNSQQS